MGSFGSYNLGAGTTVDFYLYSSHEVAGWEPIVRSLRVRGVDAMVVLEPPRVHKAHGTVPDKEKGWLDDKAAGPLRPLVDEVTHAALEAVLRAHDLDWLDRSRPDADAVVTTQGVGWLAHYGGARIKTEYGVCAFEDPFGHGPVNEGLDGILAHGEYSARALAAHAPADRIHVVGYPKWAAAKRSGLTRHDARERLGLESDLPVIAWLPTWAHNAGIEQYGGVLAELADTHLIVAKPHHNNLRFETERLSAIDPRIQLRSDLHTLVDLMVAADVVVADGRSGALAETILADRPVVGLLPGCPPRTAGVVDKLDDVVVWCAAPDALAAAVTEALDIDRSAARAVWRPWFFAATEGRDDELAADAICSIIERRRPMRPHMTLARFHELADLAEAEPGAAAVKALIDGWLHWPGHPRLRELTRRVASELGGVDLRRLSRTVRGSGHVGDCPAMAVFGDPEVATHRRVVAGATAASMFEADIAPALRHLSSALQDECFEAVLEALAPLPHAVPFFVDAAATTPDRCRALADALGRLGASEQASALTTHAENLVLQ